MDFRKYLDYGSGSDDTKEVQETQEVSRIDKVDAYETFNNCLATVDKFADKLIQRGLAYKILSDNVGIYFEITEKDCSKKLKGSYKREFNEALETLFLILENFSVLSDDLLMMHDVKVIAMTDSKQYGMNIGDNLIMVNLVNKVGTLGVMVKDAIKQPTLQVFLDEYTVGEEEDLDEQIEKDPIHLDLKDLAKISKKHKDGLFDNK